MGLPGSSSYVCLQSPKVLIVFSFLNLLPYMHGIVIHCVDVRGSAEYLPTSPVPLSSRSHLFRLTPPLLYSHSAQACGGGSAPDPSVCRLSVME